MMFNRSSGSQIAAELYAVVFYCGLQGQSFFNGAGLVKLTSHIKYCFLFVAAFLLTHATNVALGNDSVGGGSASDATSTESLTAIHPVSVVKADIYVNRKSTTMKLTCFAEDLELLQGVEPFDDGLYDLDELRDATQDHAKYLAEKITLRDADGELLIAEITDIIDFEAPEDGVKAGTLMSFQLQFEFQYRYEEPPKFITIEQNMVADGALLPSEFEYLLKQAGSNVPFSGSIKPAEPQTIQFDWDKPILGEDASEEEWAKWFDEQREKNLGITSYSSVYSFIYITEHEVRHEVLIPLATLTTMLEFERAEPSFLNVAEQEEAARKVEALFSVGNAVKIDSIEVQPVFDRIDFYGLDLSDFALQAEKRKVSMASGRVGVIMSYSTKGLPSKVEVTWDKFNNVVRSVDSVIIAFDKVDKTQFSKFLKNNTYVWEEPDREPLPPIVGVASTIEIPPAPTLTIPIASAALAALAFLFLLVGKLFLGIQTGKVFGMATGLLLLAWLASPLMKTEIPHPIAKQSKFELPDEDADLVFTRLHKNMFRAFDYHRESDIYDALAKSVDGDLLRKLYLDINKSLRVKEQGGAIANIDEVVFLEGQKEPIAGLPNAESPDVEPGFGYRCKWNLIGTIEHWGHIHQRTNSYDAKFVVQLKNDAWKITSMEVVDEQPGQVKTSLRKF